APSALRGRSRSPRDGGRLRTLGLDTRAAPGASLDPGMRQRALVVVAVVASSSWGCGRTVSCEVDLGMCHEWVDASPGLRREIEDAVCHKHDEHFAARACPRAGVAAVCELAGGHERTYFYEGHA